MMAQVNAGRVRFVGRGEYNNSNQYYVFDLVSYNGNSYYAKVDTIGNLPTDTTYWQLVAEKGNVGPTGLTGNGISSIEKTSTSGLVDTYTITFTNGNTTTFDVTNGNGIDRIEKTATVGNIDTYTIYFNDNSTSTFEVANGEVTREELEEEVDRLSMIYNAFPTTSDEDTEMTLDGTGEVKLKKIGLKGNTSQFSTTGKNLFATTGNLASSINESIQMTKTGAGTECTLTKNSTGSASPRIEFDSNFFEVNTTYYISFEVKGDWTKLEFGTWIGDQQAVIDTKTPTSTYQKVMCQFTYPSTKTSNDKVYFKNNDRNVSVGQTLTINNFMISKTNDYDYEPYTGGQPSPNPDYPQDIEVVSGDNTIKVEGKNFLVPYNASNVGVDASTEGYTMTINGTSTGASNFAWSSNFYLKAGTYRLNTTYVSGSINNNIQLIFRKYNSNNNLHSLVFGTSNYQDNTNTAFVLDEDTYIKYTIYIGGSNRTCDNYKFNIQLTTSTSADYNFVPYKLPTTYPINLGSIELCKIGDYQDKIKRSSGKNLADYKQWSFGSITTDGSETTYQNNAHSTNYIPVEPNTKYTISVSKTVSNLRLNEYTNNKTHIQRIEVGNNTKLTITTTANTYFLRWSINYDNSTTITEQLLKSLEIILNKGEQPLSYEPYGKVWCLHKDIEKVVFNGSESWSFVNQTTYMRSFFAITDINISIADNTISPICSNYFNAGAYNSHIENTITGRYNNAQINIFHNIATSGEDFKTWLSTHNTIVYYVLATPTITEITDSTLIEQLDNLENAYSYDTQTNISQTNDDMPFILDVEAILSLKNIFNS